MYDKMSRSSISTVVRLVVRTVNSFRAYVSTATLPNTPPRPMEFMGCPVRGSSRTWEGRVKGLRLRGQGILSSKSCVHGLPGPQVLTHLRMEGSRVYRG